MDQNSETTKRAERRNGVALKAFALRADGSSTDARVTDLSYGGCCIEAEQPFVEGERLVLVVQRRGKIDAKVCWSEGQLAGLSFSDEQPQASGDA